MPLTNTIKLVVNYEPIEGEVLIVPVNGTGVSLETPFTIQLLNFRDEDSPLSYRFFLFWDEDLYEEEIVRGVNPVSERRNFISDTQFMSELTTRLPMGRSQKSMEVLVMITVTDSLGAIRNCTRKLKVDPKFPSSLE